MSFAHDGLNAKIKNHTAAIKVDETHPMIQLANTIAWNEMAEIALEDLKNTTVGGFWRVGRKLYLRIHLGIFVLQAITKKTDEAIVREISENAVYQAFCGASLIRKWQCVHATKVQAFRSRLSAQTQMKLNDCIVRLAVAEGAANPTEMDIDSTVQEANISYPADARLLLQLAEKCQKLKETFRLKIPFDLKKVRSHAQKYFFAPKNKPIEERREIFATYYEKVKTMTLPLIRWSENRLKSGTTRLKWNTARYLRQVGEQGRKYLKDVGHFVKTHKLKTGKILSFHVDQVACIRKGKVGKDNEFGRVFQLGRIRGNFLIGLHSSEVNLSDKHAIAPMIEKHTELFGAGVLKSVGTDKGYYKSSNVKILQKAGVQEIGIQAPSNLKRSINKTDPTAQERIRCRRAGMEPLIGHAKRFGLGKSRMKSDESTHASGFKALMGFNLRQLERFMKSKTPKIAHAVSG